MEPNSSYNVAFALRGNERLDVNDKANAIQVDRMVGQAKRAMNHISSVPSNHAEPRTTQEAGQIALDRLNALRAKGMDIRKLYAQYDVNRNGKITYKDFGDTLLSVNSGLGRAEAQLLASELDHKKVGTINYRDMLASLQEISSHLATSKDTKKVGSINYRDILASLQETAPLIPAASGSSPVPKREGPSRASVTSSMAIEVPDGRHSSSGKVSPRAPVRFAREPAPVSPPAAAPRRAEPPAGEQSGSGGGGYLANFDSMVATKASAAPVQVSANDAPEGYLSNFERSQFSLAANTRPRTAPADVDPTFDAHYSLAASTRPRSASSGVAPNRSVVPVHNQHHDIVDVQYLSEGDFPSSHRGRSRGQGRGRSNSSGNGRGASSVTSDLSYQNEWTPTGKRTFYDINRRTSAAPYYVDPTPVEAKETRKRSHSAPPRARPLRHLEGGDESTGGPEEYSPHKHSVSLRASLFRTATGTDDSSLAAAAAAEAPVVPQRPSTPLTRRQLAERSEGMKKKLAELATRTTENGIVDQLGGRLNQLRHVLRQQDRSKSGSVNKDEFHTAMRKSGVLLTKEQIGDLYDSLARDNAQATIMGYAGNRTLNIESFVGRIQARTLAPAFSHLNSFPPSDEANDDARSVASAQSGASSRHGGSQHHAETIAERSARAEQTRIAKKVLYGSGKITNPHKVFQQIDENHVGWIGVKQLQDALNHLHSNLTQAEFNILLHNVDRTVDGKIDTTAFERMLYSTVDESDRRETAHRQASLRKSRFYNDTYRTSEGLVPGVPQFDSLTQSQANLDERLNWGRLQSVFQTKQKQVLAAFVPPDKEPVRRELMLSHMRENQANMPDSVAAVSADNIHPVTLNELQHNLRKVGVPLGSEDVNQLRQHLHRRMEQPLLCHLGQTREQRVSKDGLLTLEDFCNVMHIDINTNNRDEIVLSNPREAQRDGGIFSSSHRSLASNPTSSTSFFYSEHNDVFNERRKKIPQEEFAHTSEPSRFWEFTQCSERAVLYPQPMPSLREPLPDPRKHPLEKKNAARGIAVPDTGRVMAEGFKSAMVVQSEAALHENQELQRRRAVSTPRNASRSVVATPVDRARTTSGSSSANTSMEAGGGGGLFSSKTSEHISKWATSSLADYFESKTRQRAPPSASASVVTGTTASAATTPQHKTLMRIVNPQAGNLRAPYATSAVE